MILKYTPRRARAEWAAVAYKQQAVTAAIQAVTAVIEQEWAAVA